MLKIGSLKKTKRRTVISRLYEDMHNMGVENFLFEVVEELDSIGILEEREQFYISNSQEELYNMDKKVGHVQRGCNASQAKLSPEQLQQIIALLQENKISDREIAKKFDICFNAISEINNGWSYHQDDLSYPIRVFKQKGANRIFTDDEVRYYREQYKTLNHQAKYIYERDNLKERASYSTFYNMVRRKSYSEIE